MKKIIEIAICALPESRSTGPNLANCFGKTAINCRNCAKIFALAFRTMYKSMYFCRTMDFHKQTWQNSKEQ